MDRRSIVNLLKNFAKGPTLTGGVQLHAILFKLGFDRDLIVGNYLIDMYGNRGKLDDAYRMFDEMHERNVVSWTALMVSSINGGFPNKSLSLFSCMRGSSQIKPNEFTFSANLKACGLLGITENGVQIHGACVRGGFENHEVVGNSIIFMYSRFGRIVDAKAMFESMTNRSLVTWNAMFAGFGYVGDGENCLLLFRRMRIQKAELGSLDDFTFASLLKACSLLGAIRPSAEIHASMIVRGLISNAASENNILLGALVDVYAKCGNLTSAQRVFDQSRKKSVVQWTTLIMGNAKEGLLSESISLFRRFWVTGSRADGHVLSTIIGVFADFALLEQGKQLHCHTIRSPTSDDVSVANAIVDLYLKCGVPEEANLRFDEMPVKNVISWTVMINGHGKHGDGETAVRLFEEMQCQGIEPDGVAFLAVLSACSHSGMAKEGRRYFSKLLAGGKSRVRPKVEHFACMVDLLGRAGELQEAKELIERMPLEANEGIWQTLLSACRVHSDVEIGREAGLVLLGLGSKNAANYVMVANLLADSGEWSECEKLRGSMKKRGLKKEASGSWVEIDKVVHFFYRGDDTHVQICEIRESLAELERRIREDDGGLAWN